MFNKKKDGKEKCCENGLHRNHQSSIAWNTKGENSHDLAQYAVIHCSIPESSKETETYFPNKPHVTIEKSCLEYSCIARRKIKQEANVCGVQDSLFLYSSQNFASNYTYQEPLGMASLPENRTLRDKMGTENMMDPHEDSLMKVHYTEIDDIAPATSISNLGETPVLCMGLLYYLMPV